MVIKLDTQSAFFWFLYGDDGHRSPRLVKFCSGLKSRLLSSFTPPELLKFGWKRFLPSRITEAEPAHWDSKPFLCPLFAFRLGYGEHGRAGKFGMLWSLNTYSEAVRGSNMARGLLSLLLLFIFFADVSAGTPPILRRSLASSDACLDVFSAKGYTVIMVADPGTFSGTPEALHYEESLQNPVYVPSGLLFCPRITVGKLLGIDTIVATSGIGPTTAALCASDLAKCLGSKFKELIYTGTSGWSAAVGGILNADDCRRASTTHKIVRLGDVCVTPMSMNWNCKLADWVGQAKGYPNMCFLPEEDDGPTAAFLYGDCVFDTHTAGSLALADELLAASKTRNSLDKAPLRNSILEDSEKTYFGYISNSTHRTYNLNRKNPPKVYDYKTCVEVDSQFFYSGVPWDMTARNYSALTINLAFNTSLTAHDVIAVSAMEAIGVAQALDSYNALNKTIYKIPYVFVRANSDWLHQPVKKLADGTWTYTTTVPINFAEGYKYAIATTANVVFSMLSERCKKATSPSNALCVYTISYS